MSEGLPAALLGRTGLKVPRLGYGAMEIRGSSGGPPVTEDQAEAILNGVLDAGINYIDTGKSYGRSEEFIGKYISHRRSEYYLATKCGCYEDTHIWTKENLFRGLHESLEYFRTDYLDVMQLHGTGAGQGYRPNLEDFEQGRLVEALEEMRQQGKVRWIGISTRLPILPTLLRWGVFDVFQIPYSALERDNEVAIAEAAEAGVGTVVRGGVAQGEPGEGTGLAERWQRFEEAGLDELREDGESRTAFMLRFTLAHPQIHTTIVGTHNPEHLRENVRTAQRGPLSPDVYAEAKRRLDAAGVSPA